MLSVYLLPNEPPRYTQCGIAELLMINDDGGAGISLVELATDGLGGITSIVSRGSDGLVRLDAPQIEINAGSLGVLIDTDSDSDITLQAQGAGGTGLIHLAASQDMVLFEQGDGTDYLDIERGGADFSLIRTRNAAADTALRINGVSGDTYIGSTTITGGTFRVMRASAFTVSSDRKWKRAIADVPQHVREALRTVKARKWEDIDSGKTRVGFVANELPSEVRDDITPEQANGDGTDGAAYDVSALLALAWDEINELRTRLETLEAANT